MHWNMTNWLAKGNNYVAVSGILAIWKIYELEAGIL
jgi:hypothetical protein